MSMFTSMGKEELRAACRAAGISYGKLNNEGMRSALQAHHDATNFVARTPVQAESEAPYTPTEAEATTEAEAYTAPEGSNSPTTASAKNAVEKLSAALNKPAGKGVKIEKDREERNGVKRPSIGGACRAVWDALDAIGVTATSKDVKTLAEAQGWNANNASIEFYQWRKFNGIVGRQKKA